MNEVRIKELEAQAKSLRSQLSKVDRELVKLKVKKLEASGELKKRPAKRKRDDGGYASLANFIIHGK